MPTPNLPTLRPPHLSLVGQKVICPNHCCDENPAVLRSHRRQVQGLVAFADSINALDTTLLSNMMSSPVSEQDHHVRILLEDITQKMAAMVGHETTPFGLSLSDTIINDGDHFSKSDALGVYLYPLDSLLLIIVDTPLSQTLEPNKLKEFNQWLHHFTQHMCDTLGFNYSHNILEGELEFAAEELGLEIDEWESNINSIKEAIAQENEDQLKQVFNIEDDWFSAEYLFERTTQVIDLKELVCQVNTKKQQKYTFKKLLASLKRLIQHDSALATCPFVMQLQERLPVMSQQEGQLKGVWDVFTSEGDVYFGDQFVGTTANTYQKANSAINDYGNNMAEAGESGVISVDYHHPNAMRYIYAYIALSAEFINLTLNR